ncbi:FAD-dependent oxidoreductase [Polaromonas sp.]|uniref:FAD-dependent oxidoreductase n=1 Tax=Polaromonas sp. TaxID=1869339 RepID=UPI003BAA5827
MSSHVLIAGAGPVGLVSALTLATAGIQVTVFERNTTAPEDLRASTFHPPTLDMLARFGLTDELVSQGLVARYTQQRDRKNGLVAEFDMSLLEGETQHPFRLQCEQWKLNKLLIDRLALFPHASIVLGAEVQSVSQDADSVEISVKTASGIQAFRGDYLIGSDGAWSAVRQSLGIDFEGFTYPERFLVVSTDFEFADHFPKLSYVNYVSDPQEWCVMLRVPSLWRVLFPTSPDESDEEVLTDDSIQNRLQNLLPRELPYSTIHRTLYKVHQRVAKEFRRGRVILAGDAAHINNPLGGMGMNGGVHDAFNLSDKLVEILTAGGSPDLLDRYERQRRAVAIEYINANTARNKKTIEERDPETRRKTQDELRAIAAHPSAAKDYLRKTSMIDALERAESIT